MPMTEEEASAQDEKASCMVMLAISKVFRTRVWTRLGAGPAKVNYNQH